MTHFKVRMTKPGYYCTTFTLEEIIDGPLVVSPKVGEILDANSLFNMVVNKSIVTISPACTENV